MSLKISKFSLNWDLSFSDYLTNALSSLILGWEVNYNPSCLSILLNSSMFENPSSTFWLFFLANGFILSTWNPWLARWAEHFSQYAKVSPSISM